MGSYRSNRLATNARQSCRGASLSTSLIQTDLATGISGGIFYFLATSTANTEITSANVKRINLTTKKGSTKAYQAFTPKNTHLHFCFWNYDFHEMFGRLLLSRGLHEESAKKTRQTVPPNWRVILSSYNRKDVFEEVGLHILTEYIGRRRRLLGSTSGSARFLVFVGILRDYTVPAPAGGGGNSRLMRIWRGKRMPILLYPRTCLKRDRWRQWIIVHTRVQ